jgi:hypothetical protein
MTMSRTLPKAAALALAAATLCAGARAAAIDLGDPSVMSQRGQRLKLAVPYGSAPGERPSVGRFEVVAVRAPAGHAAPDPAAFSFARPERRNVVLVQSHEPVHAPELEIVLRVAGTDATERTLRVAVPPESLATAVPAAAVVRAPVAERAARRVPTRPDAPVR